MRTVSSHSQNWPMNFPQDQEPAEGERLQLRPLLRRLDHHQRRPDALPVGRHHGTHSDLPGAELGTWLEGNFKFPLPRIRVGSGHGPDRSASLKIGTGSKISTMVITMVPNKGCRIKNISYSAQISCLLNFNQNIVCTLSAQKKIYSINSYCG